MNSNTRNLSLAAILSLAAVSSGPKFSKEDSQISQKSKFETREPMIQIANRTQPKSRDGKAKSKSV